MDLKTLINLNNNVEFKNFIRSNINADTNKLRLKNFQELSFDVKFALLQIDCKNRIKKKLPEIFESDKMLFPCILSTEQCTAEEIAKFHASLLSPENTVLDLTAGLCVDTYYISKVVKNVTAIEINPETATLAYFNMTTNTNNVNVLCEDSINYINNCTNKYDIIFVDPARRGDNNKRLFGLADCNPNIVELIPKLSNLAKYLYIKASPMIDISQSISELHNKVTDIWVIGINNECKELLFKVDLLSQQKINADIHTLNFENSTIQSLSKAITDSSNLSKTDLTEGIYLYEPNRCIMKAQIFDSLEFKYNVTRIQHNSHLFISNNIIPDFPGRKFQIIEIISFKNNEIKHINKKHPQINVSVRNFKLSAEELKKKLKVKDGGNKYLFGTTDNLNNAILIICNKIT